MQRGGGARSFHIDNTTVSQVHNVVRDTVARETRLMTDEARHYDDVGQRFASHESVKHQCGRICSRRCAYQHRRRFLFDL
ncbi:MAG: transposase [Xanthobacteraceae bacterium]